MHVQVDPAVIAAHLEDLARIAQVVAADLRNGLAVIAQSGPAATVDPATNQALMTAAEVADALRIDIRTLRRKRSEGTAPKPLRGKGPLRWSRTAVQSWIEEHGA
jgi:predicted DNA-binding transcriptional regulator AlpA